MSKLWYEQPAGIWEEALPLGNGRLGAMVFGRIANEQIQVNEESMWLGGRVNRINPDFRENLPRVRELLDRGEISKAESLMQEAMSGCPESMHPYQTLGDILFFFREIDEKQERILHFSSCRLHDDALFCRRNGKSKFLLQIA